jgi:hypothetical protein
LYRFELNPGKLNRFDDWIRFEHAHHAETVATLEREKMYFEGVFRDRDGQKDVIYWFSGRVRFPGLQIAIFPPARPEASSGPSFW